MGSSRLELIVLSIPGEIQASLFDLDGVLTMAANVHGAVWKAMSDSYPRERAQRTCEPFFAFDPVTDHETDADGRPQAGIVVSDLAGLLDKP